MLKDCTNENCNMHIRQTFAFSLLISLLVALSFLTVIYKSQLRLSYHRQNSFPLGKTKSFLDQTTNRLTEGTSKPFVVPLSKDEIKRYFGLNHAKCARSARIGKKKDGGWDVCTEEKYHPKAPCTVYSFGINYEFSFDDGMASTFGCKVWSFDPSMKWAETHQRSPNVMFIKIGLGGNNETIKGWRMKTLTEILQDNNDTKVIIDYLKFDIERSEWHVIPNLVETGILKNVKQLGFELHSIWKSPTKIYTMLEALVKQGFRKWKFHYNPRCHSCIELYYINLDIE